MILFYLLENERLTKLLRSFGNKLNFSVSDNILNYKALKRRGLDHLVTQEISVLVKKSQREFHEGKEILLFSSETMIKYVWKY